MTTENSMSNNAKLGRFKTVADRDQYVRSFYHEQEGKRGAIIALANELGGSDQLIRKILSKDPIYKARHMQWKVQGTAIDSIFIPFDSSIRAKIRRQIKNWQRIRKLYS